MIQFFASYNQIKDINLYFAHLGGLPEDFFKIYNFQVNGLAKKLTPNAFKTLSNILVLP